MAIDPPITADGTKLTIEESRRLIDEQKAELYESIRRLNSRRNELAPISVLPPELLAKIFAFVIADRDPITQYATLELNSLWNFSYVSQNWRNIALGTPCLWDTPTFIAQPWGRAMLERSKMADLVVVDPNISLLVDLSLMKDVFDNHASRIREISLGGLNSSTLSLILQNVQPSSLRLRSLHLSREEWPDPDTPCPLFPAHLLVQPDALRRLVIGRCAFDVYAQPRPLLTNLSVERPLHRPLLSELVAALSEMPALETLKLENALPLADEPLKSDRKVQLSKLSSLHLFSDNVFEVLNVIDFLIVPWTARVNISSEIFFDSQDTEYLLIDIASPLDSFISSMTGNGEKKAYGRLRLYEADGLGLSAWRNEQLHDMPDPPDLDVALELDHTHYRSNKFWDDILRCISRFDFQTLCIDIGYGQTAIHKSFGQSTTLHTVEFQSNANVSEFLRGLVHKPEGYERLESSYYSVSFPTLQSLRFIRTSFHIDTLSYLRDCLMERCERGAALEKLSICNCYNIGEGDVRLLREIVPVVEWDVIVQTDEYEYEYEQDFDDPSESDLINFEGSDGSASYSDA